jgi:hypothetical protein
MSAQRCLTAWEGADRPAELEAVLGVLGGHVETDLGAAEHLRGEAHRRLVERGVQRRLRIGAGQAVGGHYVEVEARLPAGEVHALQGRAGQALGVAGRRRTAPARRRDGPARR